MKDYTVIHYSMRKLNGKLIQFTAGTFEQMIFHYRKMLRANLVNRVQRGSLKYYFGDKQA